VDLRPTYKELSFCEVMDEIFVFTNPCLARAAITKAKTTYTK
jgi:hypothetical protein